MVVLSSVIILLLVCILANIVNLTEAKYRRINSSCCFEDSIIDVKLPIIPIKVGNKRMNFVVDSGSDLNHINKNDLKKVKHTMLEKYSELYGKEGNKVLVPYCSLNLVYTKDCKFNDVEFLVTDLSGAFDNMEKEHNIKVHGIIGSQFLRDMGFVIDYAESTIYLK